MKKFTPEFLLIIIGLLLTQLSFGQKNYLQGSIITLSGDTIKGFIDYRNWEKNPDKVHFSKSAEGEPEIFSPIEISEFVVLDEIYRSAIVVVEVSPFLTNELQFDPEFQFRVDTAFLQTIFHGPKSLYYYKNQKGNENFYFEENNEILHLDYKRYLKEEATENVVAENKRYIGQLAVYLGDCPSIHSKLKSIKYNQESLEKLFQYYYECTQQEIEFERTVEKARLEKSVLAGMTLSKISFTGDHYDNLTKVDFPASLNFTFGISLDVVLPRNRARWSICNDIIISSFSTKAEYTDYDHENKYIIYNTTVGYSYFKIYNMARCRYPVKKFLLFVNAGLSWGFPFATSNYLTKEIKFYTSERTETGEPIASTQDFATGLVAGVGTRYKRFSLEFRYEFASNIPSGQDLSSSLNFNYFMFGYRFGK